MISFSKYFRLKFLKISVLLNYQGIHKFPRISKSVNIFVITTFADFLSKARTRELADVLLTLALA